MDGDDPGHMAGGDGDGGDDEVSFSAARESERNRGSHSRSSSVSFANNGKSFAEREMLTGVVATPCYRAPEVIMSEGKYTGAMDVWALGCIFGELLQRQSAGAHTPHLTISPLFRFDDDPTLPPPGSDEMYTDYLARRDALEREETLSLGEKPQPLGGENEATSPTPRCATLATSSGRAESELDSTSSSTSSARPPGTTSTPCLPSAGGGTCAGSAAGPGTSSVGSRWAGRGNRRWTCCCGC